VIGRTKADSVELEDKLATSHVASTDQERFGDIFRRDMPYGIVTDHGTMFVGFAAERGPLQTMLESMAGLASGRTRRTHALHPSAHRRVLLRACDRIAAAGHWERTAMMIHICLVVD
jgi:putative iron-dependent peroxidase